MPSQKILKFIADKRYSFKDRLERLRIVWPSYMRSLNAVYAAVDMDDSPGMAQTKMDAYRLLQRALHYDRIIWASPDEDTLRWEVVAPMLFGLHGGPTGKVLLDIPDGYVAGFNPEGGPRIADVDQIQTLAHQLSVAQEWNEGRWQMLWEDFLKEAGRMAEKVATAGSTIPWMVAAAVALLLVTRR